MQRRLAHLVLLTLVVALLVSLGTRPAAAEERFSSAHPAWLNGLTDFTPAPRPNTCFVWIGTDYFSDAAETNRTGWCTVTCFQATHGTADPTFEGGGTCTGTEGPYTLRRSFGCPGICP